MKAAKRAEKRATKKAAKAAAGAGVAPEAAAMSAGLPPGWQAMVDSTSGDVYYGNLETKVGAVGRKGGAPISGTGVPPKA